MGRRRCRFSAWKGALVAVAVAVFAVSGWVVFRSDTTPKGTAVGFTPPPTPTPIAIDQARPTLRVAFFGDSLTNSVYATSESNGWRPLVVDALRRQGAHVSVFKRAIPGGTFGQVLAGERVPSGVDAVFVELGTNDYGRTPEPTFWKRYLGFVDAVRAANPKAAVVCLGAWRDEGAGAYNRDAADACTHVRGVFVPLADLYDDPANRGPAGRAVFGGTSDDFHPNDRGYAAIARRVLAELKIRSA